MIDPTLPLMLNELISIDRREHSIAGIRSKPILERLVKDKDALFAVLKALSHPNLDQYSDATVAELCAQVKLAAEHKSLTSRGKRKPHAGDLLLGAISKADIPEATRRAILGGVERESDLTDPVTKKLIDEHSMKVKAEVPIGDRRADLLGFEKSWMSRTMIAVELKNDPRACDSLYDQITAYRRATDCVWVVGTPQFMIEYTLTLDALCNPTQVADTIKKSGAVLVIYDSTAKQFSRLHRDPSSAYNDAQYEALWDDLKAPVLQLEASTS